MRIKVIAFLVLYVIILLGVVLYFQGGDDTAYIDAPGTYGPDTGREEHSGNLTVNCPEVTLQNMLIDGNLYLSGDIAGGRVFLKEVEVTGSLVVIGRLETLHIEDSFINNLFVSGGTGTLTVRLKGTAVVEDTLLEAGAVLIEDLEDEEIGGFSSLVVATADEASFSGIFPSILITHNRARLALLEGRVDTLEVRGPGAGSRIDLSPVVLVNRLVLHAPAEVVGMGHVRLALIKAGGAVLELAPEELRLDAGVMAVIAGVEMVGEEEDNGAGEGEGEEGDEEGEEEEEEETSEDTARVRPSAPLGFQAAYDEAENRVTLRWQPGDEDLTDRYFLTRRVGQASNPGVLGSIRSLTYNDSSITPGSTYTYYLVAVCAEGYFSRQVSARISIPEAKPEMFTLTIILKDGSENCSVTPGPGNWEYPAETQVNLEATAGEGYRFLRWDGGPAENGLTATEITITMDGNYTITAVFESIDPPPDENGDDEEDGDNGDGSGEDDEEEEGEEEDDGGNG